MVITDDRKAKLEAAFAAREAEIKCLFYTNIWRKELGVKRLSRPQLIKRLREMGV
jgi:hypothetical protein